MSCSISPSERMTPFEGEHVVDLRLMELCHHLVGVGRAGRLDGVQIGQRRRVVGRFGERRLLVGLGEEPLGESRDLSLRSQYQRGSEIEACAASRPMALMSVRKRAAPPASSSCRCRIHWRLSANSRSRCRRWRGGDLCARTLRLQQAGREVGGPKRHPHRADDRAAPRGDDIRCGVLQLCAEGVVGGEEEPRLAALFDIVLAVPLASATVS